MVRNPQIFKERFLKFVSRSNDNFIERHKNLKAVIAVNDDLTKSFSTSIGLITIAHQLIEVRKKYL